MSAIKWDDPCGIVGNHSFGTHRYVYGEFGPFHIHAHAHELDGAGWQAWRKDGMYFVLSASLKGQTYTLDETKDSVESTLHEMRDLLNEHFGPVLRWTRDAAYPSMRVAKLEKWRLVVEEHSKWWELFVGDPGNLTRVAWDKASDPDAAQLAAEAALRSLGVVFRKENE